MFSRITIQKSALIAGLGQLIMTNLSFAIFPSLAATTIHITGIAIIIILDIIVAIAFYEFFKPVNHKLSLLAAVFRIVYAVIFLIALIKMPDIDKYYYVWDRGLLVFGIHVLLIGILVIQSNYVPKWIGVLVLIASAGYIIDSLGVFWGYSWQTAMFTFIGEMIFMIWIIFWGSKVQLGE